MRYVTAHDPSDVVLLIRIELEDSGGTQRAMAEHLGFTTKHLSMIMTGKNGVTLPVLFKMLDYVGLSMILSPPP